MCLFEVIIFLDDLLLLGLSSTLGSNILQMVQREEGSQLAGCISARSSSEVGNDIEMPQATGTV